MWIVSTFIHFLSFANYANSKKCCRFGTFVMHKYLYILIIFTLFIQESSAQTDSLRGDSTRKIKVNTPAPPMYSPQRAVLFRFHYVYSIPQADFAKRYSFFAQLGGSVGMKFESGWDLRLEGNFLFSRFVLENGVFDSIRSSNGFLIDRNGFDFDPQISMRGYSFSAHVGRLFPIGRNQNSGILVSGGIGFIQHRLHFENLNIVAPQVNGDILAGYDRRTNGYYFNEFIGYQYMSTNKLTNFFVGIEFAQGKTQYARNWNNDLMAPDNRERADNYWGIRLGWILPIYTGNRGQEEYIF
jgi:hypothetical protein